MKFLKYLNEEAESRVKKITEDEFRENLLKKCKQAITAIPIFRGDHHSFGFGFISPSQHIRKSRNTTNWYTLLMNNSKKWAKFPKRSLICSFNEGTADAYGGTYRVFPVDNSYIGICSRHDLWLSFKINNLSDLNVYLSRAFQEAMRIKTDNPNFIVEDDTFAQLKEYAKAIPEWFTNSLSNYEAKAYLKDLGYKGEDFLRFLDKLLDPARNNFLLAKIDQIPVSLAFKDHEVWTDADCYLIENTRTGINIMKDLGVQFGVSI